MTANDQRPGGMSDEAVSRATGRDWHAWLQFLDGLGAQDMDHKGIVALLAGPGQLANGWWQQMVAVGYEQARGLRIVGQTSEGAFQIGVQRTLPVSADIAWSLITESPGRAIWLGMVEDLEFRKREQYRTAEGVWGEIRSVAAGQRVRLTWHSPELSGPSTLQVYVMPSGDKASVRFHQERLSSLEERELMRQRWRDVLRRLAELAD